MTNDNLIPPAYAGLRADYSGVCRISRYDKSFVTMECPANIRSHYAHLKNNHYHKIKEREFLWKWVFLAFPKAGRAHCLKS